MTYGNVALWPFATFHGKATTWSLSLLDCNISDFPAAGVKNRIDDSKLAARSRNRHFSFGQHGRTSRQQAVLAAGAAAHLIAQPLDSASCERVPQRSLHFCGHCSNTRVRCWMVNLIRGRCFIAFVKTSRALLPA
jgi:hypothetical protein